MTVELKKGYYIDSYYDKNTRSYITTLRDKDGNQIRNAYYSGNMTDRNTDIQHIKEFFEQYLNEALNLRKTIKDTKEKTKKAKLSALSTLSPIMPDAAAGIDTFNSGVGLSEEWIHRDELEARLKKMGFRYKFNKYTDEQLYRIYQERLKYLEKKHKEKEKKKQQESEAENKRINSKDSFMKNGIEFESEDAAREYFGESMDSKVYLNDMHKAWDIDESYNYELYDDLCSEYSSLYPYDITLDQVYDEIIDKYNDEDLANDVIENLESREEEKARFEARRADAKGELEVLDQKRIQKERDKVAKATAKARVQSEHADELLVATKQQQKNLRTQAYIDTLQEEGPKLRKAEGEALAKVELENQRLEAEVGLTRNQQKLLLEHSVAVKELEQQKADVIQLLKDIRKDDPDSRITGDPALLEVDLQQLGEEQERFKSIHRQAAEARAIQYAILSQCKEVEDLKQQIQSSPYGMSFSSLYGNESNAVRAVGNLIQLRQGRAALTDKMEEIFPAVAQVQREQERKFEQIARERQELEAQKAQFEVEKVEMQNRLQDANAIIRTQEQQLAWYQEQSV